MHKAKLIIHPVRLRILQSLSLSPKTTSQIAGEIKDVPLSTLYRHLKLLLDSGLIAIMDTRLIHGIQEKRYELVEVPHLHSDEIENISTNDHLQLFTYYIVALLQGFSNYLNWQQRIDFSEDRTGYTEVDIWATHEELDSLAAILNNALSAIMLNDAGSDRQLQKFAVITYPLKKAGAEDG